MPKFLWVNNIASITGGTLNCTHSMCQALPRHRHTVLCSTSKFGKAEYQAFNGVATLVQKLPDEHFDVVVYQNSPLHEVSTEIADITVYYQHSMQGISASRKLACDHVFYVSRWLRDAIDFDGQVLYQPVTIPAPTIYSPRQGMFTVGRLCTPVASKWKAEEYLHHFRAVAKLENTWFEFVGCPKDIEPVVKEACQGRASFFPVAFSSRGHLRNWDVMLYTSSQTETFGRTVREAQRCGCVPVVSNHSGLAELVSGGYGFTTESPEESVSRVKMALGNADLKVRCKEHGDLHGSLTNWAYKFCAELGIAP